VLSDVGEALHGRPARGGVDQLRHLLEEGVEGRHEHLFTAREMDVESALRDARRRCYLRYRRARHAVSRDHFQDGLHDLGPSLLGRQPPVTCSVCRHVRSLRSPGSC